MRVAVGALALASLAWLAAGAAAECVPIADFSQDAPGAFPRGWRALREDGYPVYRVLSEDGLRFLRGLARGVGTQAALDRPWDLRDHPLLAWRWRPRVFPEGSDERRAGANDSALGVYVGFPQSIVAVKAVKYVWSRVAPVGARASASAGLTRMLVLRSGPVEGGGWTAEQVNVVDDYRRLFGADPDRPPRGIAVLTDADDTRSTAEGDYADFRVCRP